MTIYERSAILLPTEVRLISDVWIDIEYNLYSSRSSVLKRLDMVVVGTSEWITDIIYI